LRKISFIFEMMLEKIYECVIFFKRVFSSVKGGCKKRGVYYDWNERSGS
jgi:hypothetical protein